MIKRFAATLSVLIMVLCLTACSSSDDKKKEEADVTITPSVTAVPTKPLTSAPADTPTVTPEEKKATPTEKAATPSPSPVITPEEDSFEEEDDGTEKYVYKDESGNVLILSASTESEKDTALKESKNHLNGEASGHEWIAVTGNEGRDTVYMNFGKYWIKAKVGTLAGDRGIEKAADILSLIVPDDESNYQGMNGLWGYTKGAMYLEAADCILYYPGQFKNIREYDDGSVMMEDARSNARLYASIEESTYSSLDEYYFFTNAVEENELIEYGPYWFVDEHKDEDTIVYTYTALGKDCIVKVTLSYPERYDGYYWSAKEDIKCEFLNSPSWIIHSEGYGADSCYNDKYSRKMKNYYDLEYKVYLTYPELFAESSYDSERDEMCFWDAIGDAGLFFFMDDLCSSLDELEENYNHTSVDYIDDKRVKMVNEDEDYVLYAYQMDDGRILMAEIDYSDENIWAYEGFLGQINIFSSEEYTDYVYKTEYIDSCGLLLTLPETFYVYDENDCEILIEALELNMTFSVHLDSVTEEEQKSILKAFNVSSDEGEVKIYGNNIRCEKEEEHLCMGAIGKDRKAYVDFSELYNTYFGSTYTMFFDMKFAKKPEGESINGEVYSLDTVNFLKKILFVDTEEDDEREEDNDTDDENVDDYDDYYNSPQPPTGIPYFDEIKAEDIFPDSDSAGSYLKNLSEEYSKEKESDDYSATLRTAPDEDSFMKPGESYSGIYAVGGEDVFFPHENPSEYTEDWLVIFKSGVWALYDNSFSKVKDSGALIYAAEGYGDLLYTVGKTGEIISFWEFERGTLVISKYGVFDRIFDTYEY